MATEITAFAFEQLDTSLSTERTPADVLSAACAEAEQLRITARREGEAAGYEEGLVRARQETAPLIQTLGEAIRAVQATRDELTEQLSEDAAELGIAIGSQVLGAILELQPERVVDVARGALRRLADRHRVTLLVNPEDLTLISDQLQQLQSELGGIDQLDVQAERRIARGGAVARTDDGELDATIETQLDSVRQIVQSVLTGPLAGESPDRDGADPAS